ncbi:TRAP-type C4-dicarboxylate transport system, small permease component [Paracoccus halophilus]|uniref:TRAP transporter small permease protein n=1 Tax=Paracoccus halophilus TaxID=376733 RepID=A0A099F7U4_9RHOB|nr:TRAP transporter small permease [Paracoccus halophilus]KGJ06519.1 C4-dicarboxylate ABC transporter substrate-binding protein [Paracoccus halophilus]SFA37862.1 TRAP-type C4-dicarboxylate transport system, small permease component [Paracoccus halophilus]
MTAILQTMRVVLRLGTGISFLVLIGAVTVQVVGRSFIGSSPVWTEELTRFALLYLAGFGTGLALFTGDLVNVDLVSESLPGRLPWSLRLISALVVLGSCLLLLAPAWRFTRIGAMQTSPAMGVSMLYVHGSVLLLLLMLALAAGLRIAGMLTGATDGKPENLVGESE